MDFTVRQFLSPLALYLQERGFDVHCACARGPYWEELQERGLRMVELPMARRVSPLRNLRSALALARWIIRYRPHIVHAHTPLAGLIGRVVAGLCAVPVIVYTAHGFYFHERMGKWQRRRHIALEWFGALFQNALFCVSEEDVHTALRLRITRHHQVFYVGNGVDSRRFDPARPELKEARRRLREEWGVNEDGGRVLTIIGRLVREKGFPEFCDAAKSLNRLWPELHFVIVGDNVSDDRDSARAEVEALCGDAALKGRVHHLGMRDDIPEILAATDIFVLPSYREGLPTSIIEAMMMARPVIATNIRGAREAVQDGTTGFLVRPGEKSDLAGAIDYLLRNVSAAMVMGEAGRRRAVDRYEQSNILRRQWQLLRQLANMVS